MKKNQNFKKNQLKEIAGILYPMLEEDARPIDMVKALVNAGFNNFTNVQNPTSKLRDTLNSKGFKEALAKIIEENDFPNGKAEEGKADKTKSDYENDIEEGVYPESFKKLKDGTTNLEVNVVTPEGQIDITDESKVMKVLGFDPMRFKLVGANAKKGSWNMASRKDGKIDLYSFKLSASVRPLDETKGEVSFEAVQEVLRKIADKAEKPIVYKRKFDRNMEKKIAIVNIADLHLGKLAWAPECGESYDSKIAINRFNYIISESIDRLKAEKNISKIVFYWSQDFFHFDGKDQVTTAGTFQQTDVRWQKMFMLGTELLVDAIYSLKEIADVQTFYVRSNHDEQVGFYATNVLAARFANDKQVTVDLSPSPRKYVEFGINLLGFAHGDKEGKRISATMSNEQMEAWGRTLNHEFFLGHFHSQRVYEDGGVVCRHLSSPCGTDAWHNQMGFIGAQKAAQMFIRGEKTGPIAEYNIPIWE